MQYSKAPHVQMEQVVQWIYNVQNIFDMEKAIALQLVNRVKSCKVEDT